MKTKNVQPASSTPNLIELAENWIVHMLGGGGEQELKKLRRQHNKALNTDHGRARLPNNAGALALGGYRKSVIGRAKKLGWTPPNQKS